MAPRKGLSYFIKTADRQQIKNGSDGLRTMKSIKSSTSTNALSRKNVESWSSGATHPRNKYVRLRTDKTRDKCFTITCCQSVSFATCVRRHWLGFG